MRRRNFRTKTGETLGQTDPQFRVPFLDPSSSRPDSDLKRRKRVSFVGIDNGSPSNDSPEARVERSDDPKTSEYAFFKKLKSDARLRNGSKLSNKVEKSSKTSEAGVKTRGIDRPVKDRHMNSSFSMPVENARHGFRGSHASSVNRTPKESEKDPKQSSAAFSAMFSRDKNMKPWANNVRSGGADDQRGDIFSTKRQKLHQWVRDTSFPDIDELTSSGHDLVSILLTRLFPGTEKKKASKIPNKERVDRLSKAKFLDPPRLDFLKRLNGTFMGVEHRPHPENGRSIFWLGSPREKITPTLQFPAAHILSRLIPTDPEEISLESRGKAAISYAMGNSVFSPPFSKQKILPSLPLGPPEETPDCYSQAKIPYPIPSPQFRNYEPLHEETDGYCPESLSHENKEPALLLEWDSLSRRNIDNLPLSYHTNFITYPSLSSSSGNDYPWSSNDTSHDSDITDSYPTSYFEHESGRHIIQDIEPVADLNLQTLYHMNSSDDPTRDIDYNGTQKGSSVFLCPGFYHHLSSSLFYGKELQKRLPQSNSPVEHHSSTHQIIEVPRDETMSLSLFSARDMNLLEAPGPRRTHHFDSLDWPTVSFWSPQDWTDSQE